MAINAEITKNKNENNLNLLKRFSRKVQESGVLQYKKSIRYAGRPESTFVKKKKRLKSIKKKSEFERLVKLGKIAPRTTRNRR